MLFKIFSPDVWYFCICTLQRFLFFVFLYSFLPFSFFEQRLCISHCMIRVDIMTSTPTPWIHWSVLSFTAAVLPSYLIKVASNQKPQTNSTHLINLKFFFLLQFRLQEGVCVQLRDEQCSVVPKKPRLTEQNSTDTAN